MYPYSLESKDNIVDLYELKADGRFQLTLAGKIGPIMIGYDYVLFENMIADYLKGLDIEGLSFEKAIIWDWKSDIEYPNYHNNNNNIGLTI